MKKYNHREFLKVMGLGIAFLPFMGCFAPETRNQKESARRNVPPDTLHKATPGSGELIQVTEDDVLVLRRNDAAYAKFNEAFNSEVHRFPQYIAVCKTEKGVRYAVQRAAKEKLKIAVKSGGHSFEGFSTNDGGLVVNLSLMKKISWLKGEEAQVEPGCLLEDIQDRFFAQKRLLPAGSCGTVGIAGLTLGGGYGFFSRKFGLTCDSLVQIRMVGAGGEIHDSDQAPDLLWACKGGGNGNFGVITSFRFRHYPMPPDFSAFVLKFRKLTPERFLTALNTWFDTTRVLPEEAFGAFVLNGRTLTVLFTTFGPTTGFESLLKPMLVISDSCSRSLHQDLPQSLKRYYGRKGPMAFKNASAGLFRGKEDFKDCGEKIFEKVISHPGIIFQINTLGGNAANPVFEKASCFPHRHLPYLGELQSYWNSPQQKGSLIAAFEEIQDILKKAGITAHYRNYPDIRFSGWETAYYGDNYSRLQSIKRKYDPNDLFHYPQSIQV